jgi:hypothetical protein
MARELSDHVPMIQDGGASRGAEAAAWQENSQRDKKKHSSQLFHIRLLSNNRWEKLFAWQPARYVSVSAMVRAGWQNDLR